MKNFDIKPMSEYKRGTNQYSHKRKGFLDLKPRTWISVIIFVLAIIIVAVIGYYLQGIHNKFSMLEHPVMNTYAYTKPLPTPIPTKKDIVFSQKHGDIIWHIYGLESSFGKEPFLFCTKKGLVSDMGYNVLNHQCFASFTEEVQAVEKWIEAHKDMTIGQLLCLYNKGTNEQKCDYASNFLSL